MLNGDAGANILAGNAGNDILNGGGGSDTLMGGPGADTLDGGADIDTADYHLETGPVGVNLTNNANSGQAAGDTLTNIENVIGTSFDDILTGNAAANQLTGGDGNDTLEGAGARTVWSAATAPMRSSTASAAPA